MKSSRLVYLVRSAIWRGKRSFRRRFFPRQEIARLEAMAEASYDAMYYSRRFTPRECYSDAAQYLMGAISIADMHGMTAESARLRARWDHIYNVYSHQFR